jgi:hypothetical protein
VSPLPDDLPPELLRDADPLSLAWTAESAEAQLLIASLTLEVAAWEQPLRPRSVRRQRSLEKLRDTLAAIVGGLLVSWGRTPPRAVKRARTASDFSASPVGVETYRTALKGLAALGYVSLRAGVKFQRSFQFQGLPEVIMPTEALVSIAARHGVLPEIARQHFRIVPSEKVPAVPSALITMKTVWERTGGRKDRAEVALGADLDEQGRAILAQIEAVNAAAARHTVTGAMAPRWKRTFTSASAVFAGDWDLGGRWTALGGIDGCYQTLPSYLRRDIRIDDESVAEVDVAASQLTLLLGLRGMPLPSGDLYDISPWPRGVIKYFVNATLGNGRPLQRWRPGTPPDIAALSIKAVGASVLDRYPFLAEPHIGVLPERYSGAAEPVKLLPHFIMGREAAAMTAAMTTVWAAMPGELVMPIHDGLLCRESVVPTVESAIKDGYREACGVVPRLKVIRRGGVEWA